MTERTLLSRIRKYKELEAEKAAIEEEMQRLRKQMTTLLKTEGVETKAAGEHIIRWKRVTTNRFDVKEFRKDYKGLYESYCTLSDSYRFSVS